MMWNPIESAPKDGTVVILHGFYSRDPKPPMPACAGRFRDGMWWRDNSGAGYTVSCHPTHWMPLPEVHEWTVVSGPVGVVGQWCGLGSVQVSAEVSP